VLGELLDPFELRVSCGELWGESADVGDEAGQCVSVTVGDAAQTQGLVRGDGVDGQPGW